MPASHLLYNERRLFALIARGNEKAFRIVYDAYFTRLSAYVFKLCKSTYLTEEVLQEVFMKLWASRSVLNQVEVPEAYILCIAKNTAVDWLRKLARQTSLMTDLMAGIEEQSNAAENKMNGEALERLITKALSQLSGQKQQVFQLSKVEGLSHDEIASKLHLSKSTVKNHLSETVRWLRARVHSGIPSEMLLFVVLLCCFQQ